MSLLLTAITHFLRPVYRWQSKVAAAGRPWLWLFFGCPKTIGAPRPNGFGSGSECSITAIFASTHFSAEPFAIGESYPHYASL